MPRHFIRIRDLGPDARSLLVRAGEIKKSRFRGELLRGKTIVLLFEKASTRTRLSFEVGIRRLGGQCIFMTPLESQLGRSEPLEDTARVIGRYSDGIVTRTFSEEKVRKLAEYSGVPVINALTDQGHPCQVLSDVFTMYERGSDLEKVKVAWVGDGNNMANSFIEAALVFGFTLTLACPPGYAPDPSLSAEARVAGAAVTLTHDPREAVAGAHFVNTDVWASMGQEAEQKARDQAFKGFFVDDALMAAAAPGALFMHCLPAHRGEEVDAEVFEGPASIVFDQAENRLHMQMALMEWVFAERGTPAHRTV
jgi:ornithine carbamoyltransferase